MLRDVRVGDSGNFGTLGGTPEVGGTPGGTLSLDDPPPPPGGGVHLGGVVPPPGGGGTLISELQ